MLPRAVGPVARKVVRIRHAGDDVDHVADRGPVLAVGRHIVAAGLAEDVRADIHAVLMQDVRRVHQKPLDGLRLGLAVFVAKVDGARFLVFVRPVREADVVELDLIETHGLDRVDRQRDLVLPHVAAERARPVARICDHQRLAVLVRDGVFRMILAEERVVEHRQPPDGVEACVLDLLDDLPVFLDRVVRVLVRRGGIFLVHGRVIADGRAVHDVDDEGVDLRGLRVFDVLVDVRQHRRVAGQIDGVAGVRHLVVGKIGLFPREIVQTLRVAAAEPVAAPGVDGVDAEAVIDLVGFLLRRGDVLAADIPRLALIRDLIEVDDAVRRALIAQHLQLRSLLDQRAELDGVLRQPQILRRAHVDDLFRDDRIRVLRQIFLRHIPAVKRREVGQVIPHPVPLDRFVRGIRDLHPARDRAGLAQILVVIRHLRRDGADKARFIPRRGVLRRLRLVRLFGRSPGDHTDKQDEGDHDQHRDHHTPAVLAHKLPEQFQPLRPLLSARRSRHSLFPA